MLINFEVKSRQRRVSSLLAHLLLGLPLLYLHVLEDLLGREHFVLTFLLCKELLCGAALRDQVAVERVAVGHVAVVLVKAVLQTHILGLGDGILAEAVGGKAPLGAASRDDLLVLARTVVLFQLEVEGLPELGKLAPLNTGVNLFVHAGCSCLVAAGPLGDGLLARLL